MDPNGRWRELYQAALLETDPEEFAKKAQLAKQEIQRQSDEVDSRGGPVEEQRAMQDAIRMLEVIARSEQRSSSGEPSGGEL